MTNHFLGLSADGWTAILAAATFLLVATGLYQIISARYENRKTQTLAACCNYDASTNVYAALTTFWQGKISGDLKENTPKYRPQINCILNHLDAIAIGIDQGLYIESLAWDHLNAIVHGHVKSLIDSGLIEKTGTADFPSLTKEDYLHLTDLRDRWMRARPRFHEGRRWKFWSHN